MTAGYSAFAAGIMPKCAKCGELAKPVYQVSLYNKRRNNSLMFDLCRACYMKVLEVK